MRSTKNLLNHWIGEKFQFSDNACHSCAADARVGAMNASHTLILQRQYRSLRLVSPRLRR
jgi:hypothetical protein